MTASTICAIDEIPRSERITNTYDYDAFGNEVHSIGTTPNNYLYRGEFFDSDLGLYYLRARYYNPLTGRFMSRDPKDGITIAPQSLHKYLYASGDPVNWIDPTGQADEVEVNLTESEESTGSTSTLRKIGRQLGCFVNAAGKLLLGVVSSVPPPGPLPPGRSPGWEQYWGTRGGYHWFDPEGGEWRYHAPDSWHPDGHWDYNPWTSWCSAWTNIPIP